MQTRALELEAHVRNLEMSRRRGEWAMARIALDRCLRAVEAEGSEIPIEWRIWRVEIELARGNWDGANSSVKCVFFLSFSTGDCRHGFLTCLVGSDALRLQSNSPDVLTLRGLVLFLCARLPQALQHTQSALRYDPGHEPAQRLRKRVKDVERLKEEGNQAFKLGKLHEALRLYTEALEACRLVCFFVCMYADAPFSLFLSSGSAKTRTKERVVSCARCYCRIGRLLSSKYVVTTYLFFSTLSPSTDLI